MKVIIYAEVKVKKDGKAVKNQDDIMDAVTELASCTITEDGQRLDMSVSMVEPFDE